MAGRGLGILPCCKTKATVRVGVAPPRSQTCVAVTSALLKVVSTVISLTMSRWSCRCDSASSIDRRDDGGRSFAYHPSWQANGHGESARGAATKSHVRRDDIGLDQGDIFDQQSHDALALAWLDRGIVPDSRKVLDQRPQLLPGM